MKISGTTGIDLAGLPISNSGNTEVEGNLNLSGIGTRITGDFSNATASNRLAFQTSTTNSVTVLGILPNGTATSSFLTVYNNSDNNNSSVMQISARPTTVSIDTTATGTGSVLPMAFSTGGTERMRIDTAGNVGIGVVPSVSSSPSIESAVGIFTGSTEVNVNANAYYNGGWKYKNSGILAAQYNQTSGSHYWKTALSGTAGQPITWKTAMTLDGNGFLYVQTAYDGTTAAASNVNIQSNGQFLRSTSSRRYKTDIETIDKSYINTFFDNARPIYYKSLSDNDNPNWGYWGFIAEEIAEFDKRLVHWRFDTKEVEVEKERVLEDETIEKYTEIETVNDESKPMVAEGVMYERITVLLTAKVQEQQKLIDSLISRIEILEGAK